LKLKKNAFQPWIAAAIVAVLILTCIGAYLYVQTSKDNSASASTTPKLEDDPNWDLADKAEVKIYVSTGDTHTIARNVMLNDTLFGGTSLLSQYGVEYDLVVSGYANGGDVMVGINAGTIDIALIGAPPVIMKSINENAKVSIIAASNYVGSAILVKDPSIKSFADLGGKVIATPGVASIQHLMYLDEAKAAGLKTGLVPDGPLSSDTVYYKVVSPTNQEAFFKNGQIDAAVTWEPQASSILASGAAYLLKWSGDIWKDHPCTVVVVSNKFLSEHPTVVTRFIKAHMYATDWINEVLDHPGSDNYTKLAEMTAGITNRDVEVIKESFKHVVYGYDIDKAYKSRLADFAKLLDESENIDKSRWAATGYLKFEYFIDDLVDLRVLDAAERLDVSQGK